MGHFVGYIIIAIFSVLFLSISFFVHKRYPSEGVDDFCAAGRKVPFGLITASVMVSWIWTTTIIGSAEAGYDFGISGGLNYSWGAFIPFFVFIPMVMYLRKKMPKCTTFIEFIKQRYGERTSFIFMVFALGLTFYILLEQGIGMGLAFSNIFGMPYQFAAAFPLIILAIYTSQAGLRGSIINDVIMFFILGIILLVTVPITLKTIGLETIYKGLVDVATNPLNVNYNKDALNLASLPGFQYGIVAMVVAMGQIILDQGYYSKAVSTVNTKSLMLAYILGTIVAWAPIPIICGNVFGCTALGLGASVGKELAIPSDASSYIFNLVFGGGAGSIMFVLMVFMAGMTTGNDILSGAQAIFTVDIYKKYIKKDATEAQQTRFGKKMTLVVGLIMGIIVMFFKGVSLLQIDIFSGIIFAAPCAAFFAGLFFKRTSSRIAVFSIFIGMGSGIVAYFCISDQSINYFIGNICSLLVPVVVIAIGSIFSKESYDFQKLKDYVPDHVVNSVKI